MIIWQAFCVVVAITFFGVAGFFIAEFIWSLIK
jgi:hypothetical protein